MKATALVEMILKPDRMAVRQFIDEALEAGMPVENIYKEMEGAMYEVGRMWMDNEITIATEHIATAITQETIMQTYAYIVKYKKPAQHKVISFVVENEMHDLGIRMINHMLEYNGFDVTYLGTYLPTSEALRLVQENPPDLVAVSITMSTHVESAIKLVSEIKADPQLASCKVMIGGFCFKSNKELLASIPYDYYVEDLTQLLALTNEF